MGSLVPGWDSAQGVPRELAELSSDDEREREHASREGYFDRLEKSRTLRRSTTEDRPEHQKPLLQHLATMPLERTLAEMSSLGRRSTEMPSIGRRSAEFYPVVDKRHTMASSATKPFQPTDWSAELDSLKPKKSSLARYSMGASFARESAPPNYPAAPAGSWWKTLDTGGMNQGPSVDEPEEDKQFARGSFKPDLTGSSLR